MPPNLRSLSCEAATAAESAEGVSEVSDSTAKSASFGRSVSNGMIGPPSAFMQSKSPLAYLGNTLPWGKLDFVWHSSSHRFTWAFAYTLRTTRYQLWMGWYLTVTRLYAWGRKPKRNKNKKKNRGGLNPKTATRVARKSTLRVCMYKTFLDLVTHKRGTKRGVSKPSGTGVHDFRSH